MNDAFPRLLVATEFPPNAPGGGPAVVRQMLRDWPVERLCWWSCRPERDQKFGQRVAAHALAKIPDKLYPHRRWGRQKSWVLENLWSEWAARELKKSMESLQPEVIWAIPHGWSIPPLAKNLPGGPTGFHVSIHDYADCGSWVQSFGGGATRRLLAMADRLYAEATTGDAICQPMVDDLRQRTGRPGAIARAGLENEDFDFLKTSPAPNRGTIRIAYAGTIQVEKTFMLFVSALDKIRGQLPRPVSLEFFGDHSYRARPWFDPGWMNEHGNLPGARLAAALRECDWGFLPMSLTDDDPRYNRFSLPTKFISYLGAGLPVISVGHPESSLLKLTSIHEVGICATTSEPAALSQLLLHGLSQPNATLKFREGIRRCATAEFDADAMRASLYDNFKKCAAVTRQNKEK